MPSPFPGMDPYLETPLLWQDFHDSFLTYCRGSLQPYLPERYRARLGDRLVIEATDDSGTMYPDLTVVQRPAPGVRDAVAAAYAEPLEEAQASLDEPIVINCFSDGLREAYIEIYDRLGDRVVTVIELLSPSNKAPGEGRDQYLLKQKELRHVGTNLVEIDLLHQGYHTVALPRGSALPLRPYHSLISVWRASQPLKFEVYPVRLRQRLPRLRIPLLPEDENVIVNVQAVFTQCYDNAAYDRDLDYTQLPPVPLAEEDAEWVETLLSEKGLRSPAGEMTKN